MAEAARSAGRKKSSPGLKVYDGGVGGGAGGARFTSGGGGGGDEPPATRAYVDAEIKALREDLTTRIANLPGRKEFYAAVMAAVIAIIGAGAWAFSVLRDDIGRAETNAQRDADRIEGRLDRSLPQQEQR